MSYILDALRRADAERELGDVPTLHTQAVPLASSDDGFDLPAAHWGRWVALALGLLAASALTWWWLHTGATEPKPPVVLAAPPAQSMAQESSSSQPLPLLEPTAVPVVENASERIAQPPTTEVQTAVPPDVLQKKKSASHAPVLAAAASVTKSMPPTDSRRTASQTAAKLATSAPKDIVMGLTDLPEAIRREQPKLSVGGAMHSANPANRMLILNGQVFHEGDQVTADLVLEQIKLKSAVLVYKGYRYSISY